MPNLQSSPFPNASGDYLWIRLQGKWNRVLSQLYGTSMSTSKKASQLPCRIPVIDVPWSKAESKLARQERSLAIQ